MNGSLAGPLDTISARLQTMRLIGANVLELSGIEFLNCDEDKLTCWRTFHVNGLMNRRLFLLTRSSSTFSWLDERMDSAYSDNPSIQHVRCD